MLSPLPPAQPVAPPILEALQVAPLSPHVPCIDPHPVAPLPRARLGERALPRLVHERPGRQVHTLYAYILLEATRGAILLLLLYTPYAQWLLLPLLLLLIIM